MKLHSTSIKDTLAAGRALAKKLKKGDIVCLFGSMGSGKTVFVKGIAEGLGVDKDEIVSPTFVLLRAYPQARIPLYHFDLYRLKAEKEIAGLGYEEYFYGGGIAVVEWADRLGRLMPQERLDVGLSVVSRSERWITFSAAGERYKQLAGGRLR